ncbi:MAG: ATP-binding protein [Planctomycetes bacterium]|nr:ATP-binding protein [Planctomycetota bacterium]MBU4397732.1 ATP-binding protein [Planctomycetota bacterium]MCG2682751.1 ATP-binding protein [Planctomycetales bacterium]
MLIEFRVENHRSLRDEQVLTMEAGRVGDESDPRPRKVSGYPEKLLTVAGLYGANASGKSNVLAALEFMRVAVLASHRFWSPDDGVPRDPFAWGVKKPSLFEATFLIDGIRFQYGFVASDKCFLEEWLFAWPKKHKQLWFERIENNFKFGEYFKGENKLIEDVTRPNALFLSAAFQHNHPCLHAVFTWFRSVQPLNIPLHRSYSFFSSKRSSPRRYGSVQLLEEGDLRQRPLLSNEESSKQLSDQFRELLVSADFGIEDYRVEVEELEDDFHNRSKIVSYYFKHRSDSDNVWLPLDEESNGTKVMFYMALPILKTLQDGGILFIDELERSLHPYLARKIISQFNNPETNPNNAQLIFTTHDTNLLGTMLGEPALRRDQVWLTEKNPEGATELYPLTDYKPRKAENIERGYLQGRYGAIPFVENFSVAGE